MRYADKKSNMKNDINFSYAKRKYKDCLKVINEKQPFGVKDLEINGMIF